MENFTPVSASVGGALVGLSAGLLFVLIGRVAGISGILGGVLKPSAGDVAWRLFFLAGLLLGALGYSAATGRPIPIRIDSSLAQIVLAGLLVGVGTALGGGCTSGHGVCGIARLSPRSVAATAIFMTTGFGSVFVIRHLLGG
ncbi:MAG: YeeE/YedE family protein [Rhodospirillales bacterium]|nr:YeeE/YedE family protein [Rhodospirillales bacterium]